MNPQDQQQQQQDLDPSLYTSTGKRKFIPKIFVNLGRCRYEVVRTSAESLGWAIDFDDEDLASTMTKTIEQPQRSSTSNNNNKNKQQTPIVTRSNIHLLTNGSSSRNAPPVHLHEPVFRMIESRRSHIMWSDVTVTIQQLSSVAVWQRLNHFPGISQTVSRKVPLAHTMMKAWKIAPEYFSELVPLSFSLKKDTPILRQYFEEVEFSKKVAKRQGKSSSKVDQQQQEEREGIVKKQHQKMVCKMSPNNPFKDTTVFIFKPNSGCMGHDIRLTCKPLQLMQRLLSGNNINASKHLKEDEDFVCQEYIDRPMLIDKKKFDLRVYVLLMGVTPDLRILIHDEGLVRICATEYHPPKASNVKNSTMHLTNYAVNKKTLKSLKKKKKTTNDADDDDDLDEEEEEEMVEDDENNSNNTNANDNEEEGGEEIDGIKRDFKFLNNMLDRDYSSIGGSKEIWRKIDRAIVLTMMAAHSELDRIYRQASASNQVLLRRTAIQFLKEMKELKRLEDEEREKRKNKEGVTDNANDDEATNNEVGADDEEEEEDDETNTSNDDGESKNNNNKEQSQNNKKKSSPTSILDQIESEEEFINNCCIGRNCFELLGFDLLLTESGHPFVMEVNHGPSLETGAEIDMRIKSKVLQDSFRHVATFLPDSTKKKHLRARRYLQKIVRRAGTNPLMDLLPHEKLNPNTGYRLAYPNLQDEELAEEYKKAKIALQGDTLTSSNMIGESVGGTTTPTSKTPTGRVSSSVGKKFPSTTSSSSSSSAFGAGKPPKKSTTPSSSSSTTPPPPPTRALQAQNNRRTASKSLSSLLTSKKTNQDSTLTNNLMSKRTASSSSKSTATTKKVVANTTSSNGAVARKNSFSSSSSGATTNTNVGSGSSRWNFTKV